MSIHIADGRLRKEEEFLDGQLRDKVVEKLRKRGWKVSVGQEVDTRNNVDYYTYYFYRASKEIVPAEARK